MSRLAPLFLCILTPALLATSSGLPIRRTGAPSDDGGQDCSACHRGTPVNQGNGRVVINAGAYTPGVKQTISVRVEDSLGLTFGFQITARLRNDETKAAGTFSPTVDAHVLCDPDGREGPCTGGLEFAAHKAPASRSGTSRTFVIDWTPPGRDVGDVVFYAAGVAANNDGTADGDRVYTGSLRAGSLGCNQMEKPTIRAPNGVLDAASSRTLISPNSMISIYGGPFAPPGTKYQALRSDLVAGRLPTDLACVAVELGGVRAPIFYVDPGQINAQAPLLSVGGSVTVVVTVNPGTPQALRSDPGSTQVGAVSPAFFTFNGRSIAALNASSGNRILADPSVVPSGIPAKPGDYVVLYGTGFGLTFPNYQPGEFATGIARLQIPVTVTIGGIALPPEDVFYAGLAPDAPGFYQFNVRVPMSVPDGDTAVVIRLSGMETQSGATIPIKR